MPELKVKLSNTFKSKKEQIQYLIDCGYTDIRYSGKEKTFYFIA